MASRYDALIVGAGHNGLVAAAYLARAGRRVLVLERRPLVGGAAVTEEIFPGFKFSVFSYVVSLLRPEIIRDLDLPAHGLQILPLESTVVPLDNGDYLGLWSDPDQSRLELARHSPRDAEASPLFGRLMQHMAMAVKPILSMVPPDPTSLAPSDLRGMLRFAGHFRGLGSERFHALYKLMTMASADYLDEWFELDPLKATKSASGIIGTFLGPRSPGSAYVLLHHYMGEIDGAFRAWGFQKGGTGAISEAIASAARAAGAEIRTDAAVARVMVRGGRATGVVLESGRGDPRAGRDQRARSAADLPGPGRAGRPARRRGRGDPSIQVPRLLRQGEPRPLGAARFHLPPGTGAAPSRSDLDQPRPRVPRTRLRRCEVRRIFPPSLHGRRDPLDDRSRHGASGTACDERIRPVCALRPRRRLDRREAGSVRRCGGGDAGTLCTESAGRDHRPAGDHPSRHRAHHRAFGREHLPGRARAAPALLSAAASCLVEVPDPPSGLLAVRGRHPPRVVASWGHRAGWRRWRFSGSPRSA